MMQLPASSFHIALSERFLWLWRSWASQRAMRPAISAASLSSCWRVVASTWYCGSPPAVLGAVEGLGEPPGDASRHLGGALVLLLAGGRLDVVLRIAARSLGVLGAVPRRELLHLAPDSPPGRRDRHHDAAGTVDLDVVVA